MTNSGSVIYKPRPSRHNATPRQTGCAARDWDRYGLAAFT